MIQHRLPPNRKEAPRKKLRGLRRYFRRVFSMAETCRLDVSEDDWYDLWHDHVDWYGYGNRNWRMRARHLEALAILFKRLAQQLEPFSQPYQLWIYLCGQNSAYDAVYVHSPNPNQENFPVVVEEEEWGIDEVSQYFEGMLPGYRLRAGRWGDSYYVYSPDIGLPLERGE